jgi:hypothetical protein
MQGSTPSLVLAQSDKFWVVHAIGDYLGTAGNWKKTGNVTA